MEMIGMCGCFVLALGAFAPRLALVLMALFNDEITKSFDDSWIIPLVGWFVLPYSTLTYVLIHWYAGDVVGFSWLFVALAFLADAASYVGSWTRRQQAVTYVQRDNPGQYPSA
jgi:hypothetical protein